MLSLYASPWHNRSASRIVHVFKTKHILFTGLVVTRIVNILQDQRIYGGDSDGLYPIERLINNILIQVSTSFKVFDIEETY